MILECGICDCRQAPPAYTLLSADISPSKRSKRGNLSCKKHSTVPCRCSGGDKRPFHFVLALSPTEKDRSTAPPRPSTRGARSHSTPAVLCYSEPSRYVVHAYPRSDNFSRGSCDGPRGRRCGMCGAGFVEEGGGDGSGACRVHTTSVDCCCWVGKAVFLAVGIRPDLGIFGADDCGLLRAM